MSSPSDAENPTIPSYEGGKFPLTTYLASQVREILADPKRWAKLPTQVCEWLEYQQQRSLLPGAVGAPGRDVPARRQASTWSPTRSRGGSRTRRSACCSPAGWSGRGARPLGFSATDYSLGDLGAARSRRAVRAGKPSLADLFDEDMLGDDLEAWLADSYLLKRTFRNCAIISGLIERQHPGEEKTGRQVTVSTDLVYDVLRSHEPDHILLQATRADAATGLLDIQRLGEMLLRVKGRIVHQRLRRVSPLAVPIMLEISKEPVLGEARSDILAEAAEALIREAMGRSRALEACSWRARRPPRPPRSERAQTASAPAWLRCASRSPASEAVLDPAGALWLPESRHARRRRPASGEGSSFARRGMLLPPYDTGATLALAGRARGCGAIPRRVVSPGRQSFTIRAGYGAACRRPTARASPRCSAGATGSGSAATTIRELPPEHRRRHRRGASRATVCAFRHEPTAAAGAGRGRRASAPRRQGARRQGERALPRLCHRRDAHGAARLRRARRRAQRARPRLPAALRRRACCARS